MPFQDGNIYLKLFEKQSTFPIINGAGVSGKEKVIRHGYRA